MRVGPQYIELVGINMFAICLSVYQYINCHACSMIKLRRKPGFQTGCVTNYSLGIPYMVNRFKS